ncbi:hypothetical protein ScPMuIL_005904 [Solemya velum]
MSPTISFEHLDHFEDVVATAESRKTVDEYIHCGVVAFDSSSAVGLLNAADMFALADLRTVCWEYCLSCIQPGTVKDLISSAQQYRNFNQTDLLMQRKMTLGVICVSNVVGATDSFGVG